MMLVYVVVFAALGMGIWIAVIGKMISTNHAIIGLVVMGSLLLQPITGLIHHSLYKRRGEPDFAEWVHVWWGRAIIVVCCTFHLPSSAPFAPFLSTHGNQTNYELAWSY